MSVTAWRIMAAIFIAMSIIYLVTSENLVGMYGNLVISLICNATASILERLEP